jgi:hypothetical protein
MALGGGSFSSEVVSTVAAWWRRWQNSGTDRDLVQVSEEHPLQT